jgi:hypothetical protein
MLNFADAYKTNRGRETRRAIAGKNKSPFGDGRGESNNLLAVGAKRKVNDSKSEDKEPNTPTPQLWTESSLVVYNSLSGDD